jgi:hypothetical protein
MALDHSTQSGRHPLADRGNDFYETPPAATRALLEVEELPQVIWEPAAGHGAIVRVLQKTQRLVYATDIAGYGRRRGVDFLQETTRPPLCNAIVTNPPYMLASEFVAHALTLVPKVYMLLRLAFLESDKRSGILDGGQLARVHVFRNRLPMMHRDGWAGPIASSAIPFAWFVWDRAHQGPATLDRISWRKD